MNRSVSLAELPPGSSGVITEIRADASECKRLAQLGLIIGTEVKCKMRGSGGSPVAFTVHGVTLALRREICEKILLSSESAGQTWLLAGNPNVGKSTVFNALTGLKQHTGNWCGKTVSGAEGFFTCGGIQIRLIDTPGTYAVLSDTAEEAAAGKMLREIPHDCIICVCDACCPERGLRLALELLQYDRRVVVCMNLMDEAARRRIQINFQKLTELLGVPVIGITARKKQQLSALLEAAANLKPELPVSAAPLSQEELIRKAAEICKQTVSIPDTPHMPTERSDRLLTGSVLRYPLMLMLLLLVFWLTVAGANYPSALLANCFDTLCDAAQHAADSAGIPFWISGALIQGMLRGTGRVISVMLPPAAIFFPLFTLLEDIGLLPRIAFNTDHCCAKCRACGKQTLTMAMGFGCNAVGITECRIIQSKRERLIALLTNALVPCNGKFPALLAIVTVFFAGTGHGSTFRAAAVMTVLILLSIAVSFGVSALLGHTVLRGQPSAFVLELPPYRRPQLRQILLRSVLDRTISVLGRAAAVAAPVSLLIWILANLRCHGLSFLQIIAAFLSPAGKLLGTDGTVLLSFLLGMPANEIVLPIAVTAYTGTNTLTDYSGLDALRSLLCANGWTLRTAICFLLLTLFHAPCTTSLLTVYKETHSKGVTAAAFVIPAAVGVILCVSVNLLMQLFGIAA